MTLLYATAAEGTVVLLVTATMLLVEVLCTEPMKDTARVPRMHTQHRLTEATCVRAAHTHQRAGTAGRHTVTTVTHRHRAHTTEEVHLAVDGEDAS